MTEQNKLLAESLKKIAGLLEDLPEATSSTDGSADSIHVESRLDDIVTLIQQLTLKIDGIISTISNVQSQVMSLRSSIRALENNKQPTTKKPTKKDSYLPEEPKEAEPPSRPEEEAPEEETIVDDEVQSSSTKMDSSDESSGDTEEIRKELGSIEREITDLQFQHQSGFVEDDEYKKDLERLKKAREELLTKIK